MRIERIKVRQRKYLPVPYTGNEIKPSEITEVAKEGLIVTSVNSVEETTVSYGVESPSTVSLRSTGFEADDTTETNATDESVTVEEKHDDIHQASTTEMNTTDFGNNSSVPINCSLETANESILEGNTESENSVASNEENASIDEIVTPDNESPITNEDTNDCVGVNDEIVDFSAEEKEHEILHETIEFNTDTVSTDDEEINNTDEKVIYDLNESIDIPVDSSDPTDYVTVSETIENAKVEDSVESASDDLYTSDTFKNDIYEEEYGDMEYLHVEKIRRKSDSNNEAVKKKEKKSVKKKKKVNPNADNSNVINHHFETNGFLVVESSKPQTIAGLKELTYQISNNYMHIAPLLKEIRRVLCTPSSKEKNLRFEFVQSSTGIIRKFCFNLKKFGLFSKYFIDRNILEATISNTPKIIMYLNGQWLEMYTAFITQDIVSEFATQKGYTYEILTNVKVTNIQSVHVYAHEIDCVVRIADKCFAMEMKSGHFDDYSTLYNTRKELHFIPDHYLLLSTEVDEDVAETLQYFYEFYICRIENFKERLSEMINKAFAN